MKRKRLEDEVDNEVLFMKCVREDGSFYVGGNVGFIIRSEGFFLKDIKESYVEEF